MKQKCIFLVLLFMFLVSTPCFAQTCPRCSGYGQILVEGPQISHYGVPTKISDCEICGHAIFESERHHHKVCPRCNGTGKYSKGSNRSSSDENYSDDDYDNILTPVESERVTELMKMLSEGKTEIRECETCHGTGNCPGPGPHHYGNMAADVLDLNSPMPSYCPLCGGMGYCPNNKCVNGQVGYTIPCTESEKEEINNEIKLIMNNAMKREYGDSEYTLNNENEYTQNGYDDDYSGDDVQNGADDDGISLWDLFLILIAVVIIIMIAKKLL